MLCTPQSTLRAYINVQSQLYLICSTHLVSSVYVVLLLFNQVQNLPYTLIFALSPLAVSYYRMYNQRVRIHPPPPHTQYAALHCSINILKFVSYLEVKIVLAQYLVYSGVSFIVLFGVSTAGTCKPSFNSILYVQVLSNCT